MELGQSYATGSGWLLSSEDKSSVSYDKLEARRSLMRMRRRGKEGSLRILNMGIGDFEEAAVFPTEVAFELCKAVFAEPYVIRVEITPVFLDYPLTPVEHLKQVEKWENRFE